MSEIRTNPSPAAPYPRLSFATYYYTREAPENWKGDVHGTIFRASFLAGLILVIAGSAFNVLLAVLFNLISDLVGGIRFTVIEEENVRPIASEPEPRKR